jgi:hypothetical protein
MPAVCASCFCEYRLTAQDLQPIPNPIAWTSEGQRKNEELMYRQAAERAATVSLRWRQQLQRGCQRTEGQPSATVGYVLIRE